jgi:hypothetical protein
LIWFSDASQIVILLLLVLILILQVLILGRNHH